MAHTQLRVTIALIVGIGFVYSPTLATFPGENGTPTSGKRFKLR